MIPYGQQWLDDGDIAAVVDVLRSAYLTTGPRVGDFEKAVASFTGAREGVAVSSGTAALHAAMFALGIGPGDEVIVSPMTFAASANCVLYAGATPVFADVCPDTLLIDPAEVERKITQRTKAVIAVDYAGHPCDYDALHALARERDLGVVADACHSIGGSYRGRSVGRLADLSVFSFHPVKHITTGEGGMIVTDRPEWAERMRVFRNHGITTDYRQREKSGAWHYEMKYLGFNYRLTDIQSALGISQLAKLPHWIARRREIAARYDEAFRALETLSPLPVHADVGHAYHLYVIRLNLRRLPMSRGEALGRLRACGIGVNVHYVPVHLHPYYREHVGTAPGLCPNAEAAYEEILTLPLFPRMTDTDVETVVATVRKELA